MFNHKFLAFIVASIVSTTVYCASVYTEEQKAEMRAANSIFEKTVGEWCASNIYFVNNTGKNVTVRYNSCEYEAENVYDFKGSPCTSFDVLEEHEGEECYGLLHIDAASPDGGQHVVTFDPYRSKEQLEEIKRKNEYFLKQLLPSCVQSFCFVNNTGKDCLVKVNSGCEYKVGTKEKATYDFPYRSEFYKAFELVDGDGILHIDRASADGKKHIVTLDKIRSDKELVAIRQATKDFNEGLFRHLEARSFRFVNNSVGNVVLRMNGTCEYMIEQYAGVEFPYVDPPYKSLELAEGAGVLHVDRFSTDRTKYYVTLDPIRLPTFLAYQKSSPGIVSANESFDAHLADWNSRRIFFMNNTGGLCVIKVNNKCEFRIPSGSSYNFPERDDIYSSFKLLEGLGVFHIDSTGGCGHIVTLDPYRTPEELAAIKEKSKDFSALFGSKNVAAFRFKNNTKKWCVLRVNEGCEYRIGTKGEYEFPYKIGTHHAIELAEGGDDVVFHMDQTSIGGNTHFVTLDPKRT